MASGILLGQTSPSSDTHELEGRETIMIRWAKPNYWGNEKKYVSDAMRSTWISEGEYLTKLEKGFSGLLGKKYVLTMANGTVALQAAYLALGIGPGDEVIVPGFGFM